jgi:hypothetical protein
MNDAGFVDELFALIEVERNRRFLRRCKDGPMKTKQLVEDVRDPSSKRPKDDRDPTAEAHIARMRVLGLLDGAKSPGWVLVASEVLDLISAIGRAHDSDRLFTDLANCTFRKVLAAMFIGERTRDQVGFCGSATEVTNSLTYLERYRLIICVDRKEKRWRVDAPIGPWVEVLARGELLVHALLHEADRTTVQQAVATLTDRGTVVSNFSARSVPQTAMDPDLLKGIFAGGDRNGAISPLRIRYPSPVPQIAPARRTPRSEMLHRLAGGPLYSDDAHALQLVFGGLRDLDPDSARVLQRVHSLVRPGDHGAPPVSSPTACQLRGRRRRAALERDDGTIEVLELPSVRWIFEAVDGSGLSIHHAARFLADDNMLECNPYWTGMQLVMPEFPLDLTTTDNVRLSNYLNSRHALRLVERVLLHEHSVSLLPDGVVPRLTEDALTAAGHWNTVELFDAKRVINGYCSEAYDELDLELHDHDRE